MPLGSLNQAAIGPIKTSDGSILLDDREMANAFSQYFDGVVNSQLGNVNVDSVLPVTSMIMDYVDIAPSRVYDMLRHLPNRFSCSPDELPYIFLRRASLSLASPVVQIFSRSILTGKIPQIWKKSIIRPIFKKGNKHLCENYRPISLTCSLSKVLERLIITELKLYFRLNSFFCNNQHGFINRRSTGTLLLDTLREWPTALDTNCLLYTSPSPRDGLLSRMPSSA